MAYNQQNYPFKSPFRKGVEKKWYKILKYIAAHPTGVTKRQILADLYGATYNVNNYYSWYDHCMKSEAIAIIRQSPRILRGYLSDTFACMHSAHLIEYGCDKKWRLGGEGRQILLTNGETELANAYETYTKRQMDKIIRNSVYGDAFANSDFKLKKDEEYKVNSKRYTPIPNCDYNAFVNNYCTQISIDPDKMIKSLLEEAKMRIDKYLNNGNFDNLDRVKKYIEIVELLKSI